METKPTEQMKHTEGEFNNSWHAHELPEKVGYATHEIHYSKAGECVAEVVHGEANAKLIAAAPELLEFAIKAVEFIKANPLLKDSPLALKGDEAINKALD